MQQLFKRAFDLFVFTSLFIACCAVAMAYQTAILFSFPLPAALGGFIAAGTVCSYNFHWYLTPPGTKEPSVKLAWNIRHRQLHLALFLLAIPTSAFFAWQLIEYWPWLIVTAVFTFLYSAPKIPHPFFRGLRKVAVGKTVFLALAWMQVTTLLPLLLHNNELSPAAIIFAVNRFFYIYAICIVFDYRDRERDRRDKIRSLITELDEGGVDRLFYASCFITLATGIAMAIYMPVYISVLLCLPLPVLLWLYPFAKRSNSDYLYYFVLDGLMMASAPFLVLAKFAR